MFLRILKNRIIKIITLIFFIALIASFFVFRDFWEVQLKKVVGFHYVYRGDKLYKKGKIHSAIQCYKNALIFHPKHYKAMYNLANIYVSYEDYYSALDMYAKALEIRPDFINARIDYAIILSEANFDYDKAIEQYEIAVKLNPVSRYVPFVYNSKNTYKYNRGVAYYNMGLAWRGKSLMAGERTIKSREYLENAAEAYSKALKLKDCYQTRYNLGIVHQLMRNNKQAGYNYCKAIEMEPMDYSAHYNLAILLRGMEKYKEAIAEFQKAGMILDLEGNSNKTAYIYDVLNDATRMMAAKGGYEHLVENLKENDIQDDNQLTYINGKVVLTKDFNDSVLKNFKICADKKYFETKNDDEEDE